MRFTPKPLSLSRLTLIAVCTAALSSTVLAQASKTAPATPQKQMPAAKQLPTDAAPPPERVETHFEAAETFQIAGDLEKAAAEYRKGISVALRQLGNLRISKDDFESGLKLLQDAVDADPSNTNAHVDLGVAYFRAGEYNKAKESVEGVLKSDPYNFEARNLVGKSDFMQGDFAGASTELQTAISITPDFDVAYSLALAYLEQKRLSQATPLFDEMKASGGKTPELHLLLGRAYAQTGYHELAVTEFQETLKLDPAHAHVHAYLGMTYMQMGKEHYEEARKEFQQELTRSPHDYSSHYSLGVIDQEKGQFAQAETELQEAHRANPSDPGPLLMLARVYNDQKKWPAAMAQAQQVIPMLAGAPASQRALAHELLAKAYAGNGQSSDAAQETAAAESAKNEEKSAAVATSGSPSQTAEGAREMREMLMQRKSAAQPSTEAEKKFVADVSKLLGNAYNNLGVIAARASQFPAAAEEFKQASRWDPSIPQLDRNLAMASFRAQKYEDAAPALARLLQQSPGDERVRGMLGLSYYMTKQFQQSADTFRPIVNSLPDNAGLLMSAGIAFVKAGDTATGQRLLDRALQTGSNTAEVHVMLGQAYAQQDDEKQALAEFKRALEIDPKAPEAHYFAGMIYFKQGEQNDAVYEFQAELVQNPQHAGAMYQLAYIRLQQHQATEASRLLAQVIQQQPQNSDAHYQLGKALLEQGDAAAATRELETSVQLHPTDYAYFQLSHAYARSGRESDAKQALDNFEKLKPKPKNNP